MESQRKIERSIDTICHSTHVLYTKVFPLFSFFWYIRSRARASFHLLDIGYDLEFQIVFRWPPSFLAWAYFLYSLSLSRDIRIFSHFVIVSLLCLLSKTIEACNSLYIYNDYCYCIEDITFFFLCRVLRFDLFFLMVKNL